MLLRMFTKIQVKQSNELYRSQVIYYVCTHPLSYAIVHYYTLYSICTSI